MTEHTLKHPIPTEKDGQEITKVSLQMPRLIHVQKLLLAVGAELISGLMNRDKSKGDNIGETDLGKVIGSLLKQERFDAFNEALGCYLKLEPDQAGMIALDDLFEIGSKVVEFFPQATAMLKDFSAPTS
ncbi:MAG: hypothetical protein JKY49_06860 [Cohaesibacteraceae bacterium]|nr:hypothetical protein [Cohaesibacteraceae bacterium]MBL4876721.1 hypothetical protein [Cohaesibacteraceae bacterium]